MISLLLLALSSAGACEFADQQGFVLASYSGNYGSKQTTALPQVISCDGACKVPKGAEAPRRCIGYVKGCGSPPDPTKGTHIGPTEMEGLWITCNPLEGQTGCPDAKTCFALYSARRETRQIRK